MTNHLIWERDQQRNNEVYLYRTPKEQAGPMQEIDEIIAAEETGEIPEEEEDASSWTIEDGAAVKQTDRHAFLYRETIVPPEVLEYFGVEGLEPGRKRKIVLWCGDRPFDAQIEKTVHTAPRTRMLWKADFAGLLAKLYPEWQEYYRTNRAESGDTPCLRFTRRTEPGHFDVEPEGAVQGEADEEFAVPLEAGETIDNDTLHAIFRCSLLGPMRRSQKTNSLVLISDHTKPECGDQWIGKVFHYAGMGTVGEQSPASRQNSTLSASRENGVRLFLFEVFEEGNYVYTGEVELMDNPYRSRQPDAENVLRDVWVFPLRLISHRNPPIRRTGIPPIPAVPERRHMYRVVAGGTAPPAGDAPPAAAAGGPGEDLFEPDQLVPEYVRRRANGACELCGLPAPFTGRDGNPYLELHHIIPLPEGGADSIGNVVALCPNCHRKMHVLQLETDVARLQERAGRE